MFPPWINSTFPFFQSMIPAYGLVKGNEGSLYLASLLSCSRRYPLPGTLGVEDVKARCCQTILTFP